MNVGTKPVPVSHVGGERIKNGLRCPWGLHLQPRSEARLQPGELRTVRGLDARTLDRRVQWLGAVDTLGRVYKVPGRKLRQLIRREERARRNAMLE